MKKIICLLLPFVSVTAYALPYSIVPETGTTLPTSIANGATVVAYYTVTNNTGYTLNSEAKYLPPNVTQVTSGSGVCSSPFSLAPGASCTLKLNITGTVNGNDSNPHNHLFVCVKGSNGQACAGPTPNNTLNVLNLSDYANWLSTLSPGYTVQQGSVFLMVNSECSDFISIFDSCFGQNPAAPYIIPEPPIEDSYVDPDYATHFNTSGPDGTANMFYRLSDHDALVTLVSYPPKAAYFGYQSYVFSSETSNYTGITPPRERVLSPDPNRYELFGSLGNDINNAIVQNQYGTPWNSDVVMYITTSNQNLANALIAEAKSAGISANAIFVEPVGSNVITGNGETADDMVTLFRYAVPQSTDDATAWKNALASNVLVYKVSNPDISVSRFGSPEYTPHAVNNSETFLNTNPLTADSHLYQLATLMQTYLASKENRTINITPTLPTTADNSAGVPSSGLVGSVCIEYGVSCEGDNQDTSTYTYLVLDHLGLESTAFIIGVNHNVHVDSDLDLNNTDYTSIDIYNAETSAGVAGSSQTNPSAIGFDSGVLTDSAASVLSALDITPPESLAPYLSDFYITFIARDCTLANPSVTIGIEPYCINLEGTNLVPLIDPISITERSYIVPGKTTGGYVAQMTYPLVVAAS